MEGWTGNSPTGGKVKNSQEEPASPKTEAEKEQETRSDQAGKAGWPNRRGIHKTTPVIWTYLTVRFLLSGLQRLVRIIRGKNGETHPADVSAIEPDTLLLGIPSGTKHRGFRLPGLSILNQPFESDSLYQLNTYHMPHVFRKFPGLLTTLWDSNWHLYFTQEKEGL